jgi:hypothetical protein
MGGKSTAVGARKRGQKCSCAEEQTIRVVDEIRVIDMNVIIFYIVGYVIV